jgi:hypothetical protein
MNLVLPIIRLTSPYESGDFFFTEKKKNIIMDGYFTKLVYSNASFATNGIYVFISFTHRKLYDGHLATHFRETSTEEAVGHKYYIHFDPYTLDNRQYTERMFDLEDRILSLYTPSNPSKKKVFSLKTQLLNGILKIHYDTTTPEHLSQDVRSTYHLKISGVWETAVSYGITYKFTDVGTG